MDQTVAALIASSTPAAEQDQHLGPDAGGGPARPVVILIHGTFAPNAPWTQPQSSLRNALISKLGDPIIRTVVWTGKNSFEARINAGVSIAQEIRDAGLGAKVALIAHSHGGSAIAYAMKADPHAFESVHAIVCLATPFFGFSMRPGYASLLAAFIASAGFLIFQITLAAATMVGRRLSPRFGDGPYLIAIIGALLLLASSIAAVRIWQGRSRIYGLFERVILDARRWDTTEGHWKNTLFVRSMGDEVGLGLGTLQFASLVLNRTLNAIALVTSKIVRWGRRLSDGNLGKLRGALVLIPLVVVSAIPALLTAEFGYHPRYWIDVLAPWSPTFTLIEPSFGPADQVTRVAYAVALMALLLPSLLAIVFSTALIAALMLGLAMTGALGHMSLPLALATQWAVEPTPEGAYTFLNGGWTRDATKLEEVSAVLQHSEPYTAPAVVAAVVDYVTLRLTSPSTSL